LLPATSVGCALIASSRQVLASSAVIGAALWANNPAEAIYFGGTRDASAQPLNGSNSYVMHFASDKLPQAVVDAYWSVILVGVLDFRVVPNRSTASTSTITRCCAAKPTARSRSPSGRSLCRACRNRTGCRQPKTSRSRSPSTYVPKDVVKRWNGRRRR
jgi:Protein of unknown function (DUF1214)